MKQNWIRSLRFEKKERERTDEDGTVWILRPEAKKIFGIDTGLMGRERWYRKAQVNTDRLIIKAAFLGWAGAHRFSLGEWKTGIFYLITAGCAGILPALDILTCLLGSGSYEETILSEDGRETRKERVYFRRPENKILAVIGMAAALLISYVMLRFVYAFGLEILAKAITAVMHYLTGNAGQEFSIS